MSSTNKSYTIQVQASVEEHWSTAIRSAQVTLSLLSAFESEGIQEVNQALVSLRSLVKSDGYLDLSKGKQEKELDQDQQQKMNQTSKQKQTKRNDDPSPLNRIFSDDECATVDWQKVDPVKDPVLNKKACKKQSVSEPTTSPPPPSVSKFLSRASHQEQQYARQHQWQQIPSHQPNNHDRRQPKMNLKQLIEFDDDLIQLARSISSATNTPAANSSPSTTNKSSSVSGRSSSMGFGNKPSSREAHMRTKVPKEPQHQTNDNKPTSEPFIGNRLDRELISKLEACRLDQEKNVSRQANQSGAKRAADPTDNWTKPEKRPEVMICEIPPWPIRKKPPGPRVEYPGAGDTESEGDDEQDD